MTGRIKGEENMSIKRNIVLGFAVLLGVGVMVHGPANAQKTIKIGVLSDMTAVTADIAGDGSVSAAKMAVQDMSKEMPGWKIDVISGDFQFKPDLAATIAKQWYDQDGVNVIVDVPNSGAALAIQDIARTRNVLAFYAGAANVALVQANCSPHGVLWLYDQYSNPNSLVIGLQKLNLKKWSFFTGDYNGAISSEMSMKDLLKKAGLEVVGGLRAPMSTTDFSPYVLQARASNADAIVVILGGAPTVRAIQAFRDFGTKQVLISTTDFIQDIKGMGLDAAQGLIFPEIFYWDQNDGTRAWSKRFFDMTQKMPSSIHAGVYTEVLHYLKAVKAAGVTDADKVMEKAREIPIDDFMIHDGHIAINGQVLRDRHIWQVKSPAESKGPWDLYKPVATVPAKEAAFLPEDSGCSLVKK
jgi:branched-chain amino acid transport system substrate-binding protein